MFMSTHVHLPMYTILLSCICLILPGTNLGCPSAIDLLSTSTIIYIMSSNAPRSLACDAAFLYDQMYGASSIGCKAAYMNAFEVQGYQFAHETLHHRMDLRL